VKRINGLFVIALFMLPACSKKQTIPKEKHVCDARRVRRDSLITSTSQLPKTLLVPDYSFVESQQRTISFRDQAEQSEARLEDVPIPIMAKIQGASCDDQGGTMFVYDVTLEKEKMIEFYADEMERLGWEKVSLFDADEVLMSFSKPCKVCTVSIRPTRKTWERSKTLKAHIFVGV